MAEPVWTDRKRTFLGLPLSFTTYELTEEKLMIKSGILRRREEEIRLYRILDVTLRRSLGQRLFGVGTIHCCSADRSTPEFNIESVSSPANVRDLLSDLIELSRERKRVTSREYMDDDGDEEMHGTGL